MDKMQNKGAIQTCVVLKKKWLSAGLLFLADCFRKACTIWWWKKGLERGKKKRGPGSAVKLRKQNVSGKAF